MQRLVRQRARGVNTIFRLANTSLLQVYLIWIINKPEEGWCWPAEILHLRLVHVVWPVFALFPYSFELFFPWTNLFMTFVVFACFASTRINMRFRAKNTWDSAQGFIQCMKCIANPVMRTDGRTYVRTDGHVTITSLPKFLGLIGCQISLAMVLRWRASALAPLFVWISIMYALLNESVFTYSNLHILVDHRRLSAPSRA